MDLSAQFAMPALSVWGCELVLADVHVKLHFPPRWVTVTTGVSGCWVCVVKSPLVLGVLSQQTQIIFSSLLHWLYCRLPHLRVQLCFHVWPLWVQPLFFSFIFYLWLCYWPEVGNGHITSPFCASVFSWGNQGGGLAFLEQHLGKSLVQELALAVVFIILQWLPWHCGWQVTLDWSYWHNQVHILMGHCVSLRSQKNFWLYISFFCRKSKYNNKVGNSWLSASAFCKSWAVDSLCWVHSEIQGAAHSVCKKASASNCLHSVLNGLEHTTGEKLLCISCSWTLLYCHYSQVDYLLWTSRSRAGNKILFFLVFTEVLMSGF